MALRETITGNDDAFLRLAAATLIGAIIGLNRELRGKPAGMRTHALVSLGAAMLTLSIVALASRGAAINADAVSRVVQGIIVGVGFLGGGVIIKTADRHDVRNLTTAASVWVVACLGIVCGAGQWSIAAAALALTLLVLVFGGPTENAIRHAILRRFPPRPAPPAARHPRRHHRTGEQRAIEPDDDA